MSVIPQSSFIFNGTLKYNIDPMDQFTNFDIEQIIRKYKLYNLLNPQFSEKDTQSNLDLQFAEQV